MTRPVVWAVVHDLERTGVPVALERLVRWHAAEPAAEVHVVAGADGPLHRAMARSAASVTVLGPAAGRDAPGAAAAALAQLGRTGAARAVRARSARHRVRHLPKPDVVLLQGAGAWPVWALLDGPQPAATRLVVHLHELTTGLDRSIPPAARAPLFERAAAILAVSDATAALAVGAGAPADRVAIVPGTVDTVAGGRAEPAPITTMLGLGEAGWRKGTDRFIAVAHHLARTRPGLAATWIGREPPPGWAFTVGADLPVTWQAARPDPWPSGAGSVLVVPSREDPLPLVALEAGARSIPVVAAATGGLVDLLADGRGLVVPGHDLAGLAAAVEATVDAPEQAAARAARLCAFVHDHHRTAVVGPRWLELVLGTPPRA